MVPDKKPNEFKGLNPENCPEALETVNIWVALLTLRTHSVSGGPTSPAEGPSRRMAVLGQYYKPGNTATVIQGACLRKTKMAQLPRPGAAFSRESTFCGQPSPRVRNNT